MSVDASLIVLDYSRDKLFNEFTRQTLEERYMLPGETSPQNAFARAAAAFADDLPHAQRLYDYVSQLWFMFATPLLSNGGAQRGLPISCFLNVVEDSRESIFEHWAETGWLSSVGGGVGGYWGQLRSNGEKTSRGSSSTGVVPFIAVVDREILAVSQGGSRRGSYAAYLDISHPEIEEFITMRKPTGGDQNRKATNLHNAVNITDEFMHAVERNTTFDLRSPNTGAVIKTLKARDLWRLLIETRMQTGEPYMVFIDTINRALPESQKALGLKVNQSNLCVAPYTEILTDKGYAPIAALVDSEVAAWNGSEFSKVTIRKTSDKAELIRVWFSDGGRIDCTPEHNFYLADGSKVKAAQLENGMTLEVHTHPLRKGPVGGPDAPSAAFVAGWVTFTGHDDDGTLSISIRNDLDEDTQRKLLKQSKNVVETKLGLDIFYEPKTVNAGVVPFHLSVIERHQWLLGAFESAGEWDENGNNFLLATTDSDLAVEIRLLALELGCRIKLTQIDTLNVLSAAKSEYMLLKLGTAGSSVIEVTVADVHPLPFQMATYCATEPKRGRLTFNGYVTGNCTEITLPTGRDHLDRMRTAVCCLSSVNAEKWAEWKDHPTFIEDLMRMLDNALESFIDNAPEALNNAVYSAARERSVGLGLLGFQAYLQSQSVPMESPEARAINLEMFRAIRAKANAASLKLGAERGEAPDMVGTGERFAHKLAIAPNASSSITCGGTSPSIEPHRANAYLHKTLSGSFPVKNKFLIAALQKLDMDTEEVWRTIIANEGSVQHLDIPDHVKAVFKTATEIDQNVLVSLAADRAPLICQAQSLNLFFEFPDPEDKEAWAVMAQTLTVPHYTAWKSGVKSLYYLRSTTPSRAENTNDKVERKAMVEELAPIEDEGCLSCEG